MSIKVEIVDEKLGVSATLTPRGELIVSPIAHSVPYYISVAVAATEYQVVPGIPGKCFVITGLLLASNRDFGTATTPETLTIYEANPADLATNEKTIVQIDLLKNDRITPTGLDLLVNEAKALVAVGTDSAVDVTIAGYYVNV